MPALIEEFKAWCATMGIAPKSHDYSIAKAAWTAAIDAALNKMKKEIKR